MQYKLSYFPDGKITNTIKIDSWFPLRDGGASEMEMYMICDPEKIVALTPDLQHARRIAEDLNEQYYAGGGK